MDYALVWDRLVPGTKYTGSIDTPTFRWTDERPQPTEEECQAEWEKYLAEEAKKASDAAAYEAYVASVNAGFTYNGVTYPCTDTFTTDLVKMVMLVQLKPEEPVYLMSIDGEIVTMSCAIFLVFASAIGYYAYSLRQAYWAAIQ